MSELSPQPVGEVQARYDVIVVGAGLAGLLAGVLAARQGARTLVIARGLGGTQLGPGTIDVWGYRLGSAAAGTPADSPLAELPRLSGTNHPLALAGTDALSAALDALKTLCAAGGYGLSGTLDRNYHLPTAVGAVRPTCLAPESFVAGDVRAQGELTLADIPGFRDFYAAFAAANLRAAGFQARALALPLPRLPARREAFATDVARLMDQPAYRAEVAERWRPLLSRVTRLGVPAVLGLRAPAAAWRDLSERLGVALFEIPLMPPSVPGMRLFDQLRAVLEGAGGRLIIGPVVRGWVAGAPPGARLRGVWVAGANRPRAYAAAHVILATGGFRHGGLHSPAPGQVVETVFDLPVETGPDWFAPFYWDRHPYSAFGLRVNSRLQPIGLDGQAIFPNLSAIGGLLAGADRDGEGCREGIDLATAYCAVSQLEAITPT